MDRVIDSGVPIRAVSRSLSVLRTINQFGSISMRDITQHAGLTYPTASRILQTLAHEGLIERDGSTKRYRPTVLVQTLASGYDNAALRAAGQSHMSDLTHEIGWPVMMSVHAGMSMVVQAATNSETTLSFFDWQPGCTIPLIGSATGLAWMTQLSDDYAADLIRQRADESGLGNLGGEALLTALREVRRTGFACRASPVGDPYRTVSLATPVKKDGRVVCVLTLTYFASAMTQATAIDRYAQRLIDTASAIAATLHLSTC